LPSGSWQLAGDGVQPVVFPVDACGLTPLLYAQSAKYQQRQEAAGQNAGRQQERCQRRVRTAGRTGR
jgi:hypothetical protein